MPRRAFNMLLPAVPAAISRKFSILYDAGGRFRHFDFRPPPGQSIAQS
jgi:hypothetical protein